MSATRIYLELADRRLPVPVGTSTIGRSRRCEVVIPDPSISRNHALISVAGGRITLKDLESSNGTFINGERLTGESEIADGDLLGLGETEVRLRVESPEEDLGAYTVRIPLPGAASRQADHPLSASEAMAVGDVLPVGEVLAEPSPSWDRTGILASSKPQPAPRPQVVPPPPRPQAVPPPRQAAAGAAATPVPEAPGPRPVPEAPGRRPMPPVPAPAPRPAASAAPAPLPRKRSPAPPPPAPAPDPRPPARTPAGGGALAARPAPAAAAPAAEAAPSGGASAGEVLPSIEDLERQMALAEAGGEGGVTQAAAPAFLPPAGFWARAAAVLFDSLLIAVLGLAASFAAGGPLESAGGMVASATMLALSVLVPVAGWSRWATTPGKRLLGLYVCDREGRLGIPVGRALLRWVAYGASALPLGLGFVLAGLNTDHRALHDYIARTYVGRRG